MSPEELTRLAVLGVIEELPEEHKQEVKQCIERLRKLIAEYGGITGALAVTLIGAEMQADAAKRGF